MGLLSSIIMVINGSDFINNPWNITFKAFTDVFGNLFYLIPVTGIALALYIKTREPSMVMAFLVAAGLLLSAGNMFLGAPVMGTIYLVFSALAMTGLVMSIYFSRKVG